MVSDIQKEPLKGWCTDSKIKLACAYAQADLLFLSANSMSGIEMAWWHYENDGVTFMKITETCLLYEISSQSC